LAVDPMDRVARHRLNGANLSDIHRADVVVAWTMTGVPSATLCEIGYAVGIGKHVLWVQGPDGAGANLFDAHQNVFVISHIREYRREPPDVERTPIKTPIGGATAAWHAIRAMVRDGLICRSPEMYQ
jgi:hypothetical protein